MQLNYDEKVRACIINCKRFYKRRGLRKRKAILIVKRGFGKPAWVLR